MVEMGLWLMEGLVCHGSFHHSQLFYYVYFLLYYSFVGFGFGFSTSFYASAA